MESGAYNVLDFGAMGDGCDDTAAIQAAINAALANGGGVVYFPATGKVLFDRTNGRRSG